MRVETVPVTLVIVSLTVLVPSAAAGVIWESTPPWEPMDAPGGSDSYFRAFVSDDGQRIVTSARDSVSVFESNRSIPIFLAEVSAAQETAEPEAFSRDGTRLARTTQAGVDVYTLDDGVALAYSIEGTFDPSGFTGVFVSPDGARVYVVDAFVVLALDGTTGDLLWRFDSLERISFADHAQDADAVAIAFPSPDTVGPVRGGAWTVLSGQDGSVLWGGVSGNPLPRIDISSDGQWLLAQVGATLGASLFQFPSPVPFQVLGTGGGSELRAAFLRDGSAFALNDAREAEGTAVWALNAAGPATEHAWIPGLLAAGSDGDAFMLTEFVDGDFTGTLLVVDGHGTVVDSVPGQQYAMINSAAIPRGPRYAFVADQTLHVGEIGRSNRPPVLRLTEPTDCAQEVTAPPEHQRLDYGAWHDAGGAVDVRLVATAQDPEGNGTDLEWSHGRKWGLGYGESGWWRSGNEFKPVPSNGRITITGAGGYEQFSVVFRALDDEGALTPASCHVQFSSFLDGIPAPGWSLALLAAIAAVALPNVAHRRGLQRAR